MLPLLGQENIQKVMTYIFDALATGVVDVSNEEIGEALGLSNDTVRTCRSRGFSRLQTRAVERGLTDETFDFLELADEERNDDDE